MGLELCPVGDGIIEVAWEELDVALELASHVVLLCYWHLHEGATLWGPLCVVLLLYCLSLRLASCNSECTVSCFQC